MKHDVARNNADVVPTIIAVRVITEREQHECFRERTTADAKQRGTPAFCLTRQQPVRSGLPFEGHWTPLLDIKWCGVGSCPTSPFQAPLMLAEAS